jgi:hypothetical protein
MNHFINQTRPLDMSEVPEYCFGGKECSSNFSNLMHQLYLAAKYVYKCSINPTILTLNTSRRHIKRASHQVIMQYQSNKILPYTFPHKRTLKQGKSLAHYFVCQFT